MGIDVFPARTGAPDKNIGTTRITIVSLMAQPKRLGPHTIKK
jgi:hypothetical protein